MKALDETEAFQLLKRGAGKRAAVHGEAGFAQQFFQRCFAMRFSDDPICRADEHAAPLPATLLHIEQIKAPCVAQEFEINGRVDGEAIGDQFRVRHEATSIARGVGQTLTQAK